MLEVEATARNYPRAGATVDGRLVREHVPNRDSIAGSLEEYEILSGIREVPTSVFPNFSQPAIFDKRTRDLADAIAASGEINPLIVVIDDIGAYVLEGSTRYDALRILKARSLPAEVVIDREKVPEADDDDPPEHSERGELMAHTLVKITQPQDTAFERGQIVHRDYAEAINAIAHDQGDAPALYRVLREGEVPKIRIEDPGDIGFVPGSDQPASVFEELSVRAMDEYRVPPTGRDPAELMLTPEAEELYQKSYGEDAIRQIAVDAGVSEDYVESLLDVGYTLSEIAEKLAMEGPPAGNPGDPLIAADLELIRADAVGELAAINQYERHILAVNSRKAKTVLEHIEAQEKEHLAELNTLIASMDPTQAAKFAESGMAGGGDMQARVEDLEAQVERLAGPHIELVRGSLGGGGAPAEGPRVQLVEAEGPPPGQSIAEWVSAIGGSPGFVVDPGIARSTPCIGYDLGPGHKPLVYSKGIRGPLDDEQQALYCQEGTALKEMTEKQRQRMEAFSTAASLCGHQASGTDTRSDLDNFWDCMGKESRKLGVEPW